MSSSSSSSLHSSPESNVSVPTKSFYGGENVPRPKKRQIHIDPKNLPVSKPSSRNRNPRRPITFRAAKKNIRESVNKTSPDEVKIQSRRSTQRRAANVAAEKIFKSSNREFADESLVERRKNPRRTAASQVVERISKANNLKFSDESEISDDERWQCDSDDELRDHNFTGNDSPWSYVRRTGKIAPNKQTQIDSLPVPKAEFSEYELEAKKNVDIRMKFLQSLKFSDEN